MNKLFKYLTLAAAIAGFSQLAYATSQILLWDGIAGDPWVVVATGATGVGQITWTGSYNGFTLNVDTGTGYPAIGSLTAPKLDLTFNAVSNSAGSIYIAFTENGFGPTDGSSQAKIGGTTDGFVSFLTFGGSSNVLNDGSTLLTQEGPFTANFTGTVGGAGLRNAGPFSLMEIVRITHGVGQGLQTSGDATLTVPDAGTTLLFLGAGLTGLALIGRRQKRRAS
jgi:hypothetical protein